jgi:hypothetical protein
VPHLDELIPLAQAARRLPNRPHVSALWRWCRLGIRGRGGDRVRLEHTRIGMRLYTTEAWLADFGRRLEEADREHFDARHVDHPQARGHRRQARARSGSSSSSQRLEAAAARLKEAGL